MERYKELFGTSQQAIDKRLEWLDSSKNDPKRNWVNVINHFHKIVKELAPLIYLKGLLEKKDCSPEQLDFIKIQTKTIIETINFKPILSIAKGRVSSLSEYHKDNEDIAMQLMYIFNRFSDLEELYSICSDD